MTVGGGVGVDTDVRPDKTTYTGLPLTHRPSIVAVPSIVAGAVLLLFTSLAAAARRRKSDTEWGYGENMWNRDLDYGATGVLQVSSVAVAAHATAARGII